MAVLRSFLTHPGRLGLVLGVLLLVAIAAGVLWPRADSAFANPIGGIASVSAGEAHTCAVTTSGGAKCWGDNSSGQLGDPTTFLSSTPVDVTGLTSGVAAVAAGFKHTCALTATGGVKCWGSNVYGQLGDGTTTDSDSPVDVSGLTSGVAAVAVGAIHTCAVTTGGGAKCWGQNDAGQLGDGTTSGSSTPVDVSGLTSGVAAVAVGSGHTCAVTTVGGVKCWGSNFYGKLGDGTTTDSSTPVDVSGLTSGVAAVAAGFGHTCAVTTASGVKCWGFNEFGQLGDGTTTDSSTPVAVSGLTSGVAAIAANDSVTCTVMTASGVKCWGSNFAGQLGDGTSANSSTPVDVSGLTSGAAAVSAGGVHSCAVTSAAGLKCWGANPFGQLGNGTTTSATTPVDVVSVAKPTPTPTACPPEGCPTVLSPCPGPCMALDIPDADCTGSWPGLKCTVFRGVPFTIAIEGDDGADPNEAFGMATSVDLDGLNFTPSNADLDFTPCGIAASGVDTAGNVGHTCVPFSTAGWNNEPAIVTMAGVQCKADGVYEVVLAAELLTSPSPFGGSKFFAEDLSGILLKTSGLQAWTQANGTVILVPVADVLTVNCVEPPPSSFQKQPGLQNLFLTRQGDKIPPVRCIDSDDTAVLSQTLSLPVTSPDPKEPEVEQELGAFEFEVHYDPQKVCVEIVPGPAAGDMICAIEDVVTKPALEGVARIGCVTLGKENFPDTSTPDGRHLADVVVRPQPEVYSQAIPNQENGVVAQLLNQKCELADLQGHPIPHLSCDDADVTMRYLEGDVEPDCQITALDTQAIAFRWGATKGSLFYTERFNLEPSGTQTDDDIDIKDLQFVFGRFGSTCADPHPAQEPVNPKA